MSRRTISGKRTVITGASSGIGRELATQMALRGARLLLIARRESRLIELVDQITALGGEAYYIAGDITASVDRVRLVESANARLGGIDILVNNAGVGAIGDFSEANPERLSAIMDVNFTAPVELIRAALPSLKRGNKPIIVNVGSVLGHCGMPKKSEYCASKFALRGFTNSLRAELHSQIDVLLVSPNTTKSDFFDNVLESTADFTRNPMAQSVTDVAEKMIHAVERGKREIILTIPGKALVLAHRILPNVLSLILSRFG